MAMTAEGGYLPCKNPNCKSHGKSHPNCRCYGDRPDVVMAEGGQVPAYCEGPHKSDCEYYAEGGSVEPHHKVGAKVLSDHLANGLMKGHHDVSDAILGHKDPSPLIAAVTAHGGAPSLLRIGSTGIFSPKEPQRPKATSERSQRLLEGLGMASKGQLDHPEHQKALEEGLEHPWFRKGADLHGKLPEMMANPKEVALHPMMEKLVGRDVHSSAQAHLVPTALKLVAQEATPGEMEHGISYAEHIGKGLQKIDKTVGTLFDYEAKAPEVERDLKARSKLHDYIAEGRLSDEVFSEGTPHPDGEPSVTEGTEAIAKHFPEQNTLLQATKARVVTYLNSLKPQTQPALPFDRPPVNKRQERQYYNALDVANHPLGVVDKVKSGTVSPSDIQALGAMYPELYQYLSQKMTEKLSESQFANETVPMDVRRSMSMFLAAPLSATMTPGSIQTIQAIYAKKRAAAPQDGQGVPKKSTANLSKEAQGSQTSAQALASRQLRSK